MLKLICKNKKNGMMTMMNFMKMGIAWKIKSIMEQIPQKKKMRMREHISWM